MLVEVDLKTYNEFFPVSPHPFISGPFIEFNKAKTEKVIRLVERNKKALIGITAGIKNGILQSPFSAPFGGFHFRNENIYISEIDSFISSLKEYIISLRLKGIQIILPPDLYNLSFNTKTINSLIRNKFEMKIPDITCWINLSQFEGVFTQKNSREYYRQAVRNGLSFTLASEEEEKKGIFDIIYENRTRFNRPIFMTLNDLLDMNTLWPVDFFKICRDDGLIVASAIIYRFHPEICYAVFWGDSEVGRSLRAMDFLAFNLWIYYKNLGYSYFDIGTSTEAGEPNEGLLRFKESHESVSSLRFKFTWNAPV